MRGSRLFAVTGVLYALLSSGEIENTMAAETIWRHTGWYENEKPKDQLLGHTLQEAAKIWDQGASNLPLKDRVAVDEKLADSSLVKALRTSNAYQFQYVWFFGKRGNRYRPQFDTMQSLPPETAIMFWTGYLICDRHDYCRKEDAPNEEEKKGAVKKFRVLLLKLNYIPDLLESQQMLDDTLARLDMKTWELFFFMKNIHLY